MSRISLFPTSLWVCTSGLCYYADLCSASRYQYNNQSTDPHTVRIFIFSHSLTGFSTDYSTSFLFLIFLDLSTLSSLFSPSHLHVVRSIYQSQHPSYSMSYSHAYYYSHLYSKSYLHSHLWSCFFFEGAWCWPRPHRFKCWWIEISHCIWERNIDKTLGLSHRYAHRLVVPAPLIFVLTLPWILHSSSTPLFLLLDFVCAHHLLIKYRKFCP